MDGQEAATAYSELYGDRAMTEEAPVERTDQSPSIAKLAAALCKAQSQMEGAKKNSSNPHFKNAYADLESVWEACRKPLTENGLAVIQAPEGEGDHVVLETILLHNSGEYLSRRLPIRPTKNDPQGVGSAITYARRYALMAMVGLAPEDDDGEAASGRGQQSGGEQAPDENEVAAWQAKAEECTTKAELREVWKRMPKQLHEPLRDAFTQISNALPDEEAA